jgi:hypothetical protein
MKLVIANLLASISTACADAAQELRSETIETLNEKNAIDKLAYPDKSNPSGAPIESVKPKAEPKPKKEKSTEVPAGIREVFEHEVAPPGGKHEVKIFKEQWAAMTPAEQKAYIAGEINSKKEKIAVRKVGKTADETLNEIIEAAEKAGVLPHDDLHGTDTQSDLDSFDDLGAPAEEEINLDDLRAKLREIAGSKGRAVAEGLMTKWGVKNVAALAKKDLAAFKKELLALG